MNGMADRQDDLRQSLLKTKIAKLPHLPAISPSQWASGSKSMEAAIGEDSDSIGNLTIAPPPRTAFQRSAESRQLDRLYSPISAEDCFNEALEVDIDDETENGIRHMNSVPAKEGNASKAEAIFRIYYTPPIKKTANRAPQRPPQSSSKQSLSLDRLDPNDLLHKDQNLDDRGFDMMEGSAGTVFFLHHGAGYSGLSYALVAKHITKITHGEAGVLALDCRGHGKTRHETTSESQELSMQNLTNDCVDVLRMMFPPSEAQPTLILVGHSMGGSVVVSLCHALATLSETQNVPRVAGVAVLDVVEGSALSALPGMKSIVSTLPKGFDSVEEAIRWHVDSGNIVNTESARRSVPSLIIPSSVKPPRGITSEVEHLEGPEDNEAVEELQDSFTSAIDVDKQFAYTWRANLLATEPYWDSWFRGLSQSFLSVKCARLLLLAGTDRLDKDLMIGQMQGKYQLVVFADVGHSLQEDAPERTAQTLVDFWKRNESLDVESIRGGLRRVGQP